MRTWVITGGVGCGKSCVLERLQNLLGPEARAFSADRQVHLLLNEPKIVSSLVNAFGPQAAVLGQDGLVPNRAWLRDLAFGDAGARSRLEALLHPGVLAALEAHRETAATDPAVNLFLAEVPLHYEIGATVSADLVIVVAASPAVQVRRLMERRGLDLSIIQQMLRAQWPIEAKVERADVVIWNDGDMEALELQLLTLARQYRPE